tara:strand:+ start:629 stop:4834 length:4206 start_codon:yes stop_codon:yes gene_type:complete
MKRFNWKKIVSIHKEIVKRDEEKFFQIPLKDNWGERSACFEDHNVINLTGPWEIGFEHLRNTRFIDNLKLKKFEQFFLGGPMIEISEGQANPLIYREATLKIKSENIILSPAHSKWHVSPPFIKFINKYVHQEDFDDWLSEKIEFLKKDKFNTQNIINAFLEDFEFLEEKFKKINNSTSWSIFAPKGDGGKFNVNLMRDYEILHESISKGKGGLSLFENPQKVKITNSEIIPIVPLNKEQEKSVNSFLSDNKLSVVTGPPGTGKSQVVVSALLNAWAQGKTVLFSSSNNTAVDVIKERLDEFDSNTPLYIRAGSKEKNNIQDVLQTVYMMCSEPEDININEIKEEEKKLTRKIKEISKQIESGKPKQITELYQSAEKAYSEFLTAKSELFEIQKELLERKKIVFKKVNLDLDLINESVEKLERWFDDYLKSKREFQDSLNISEEKKQLFDRDFKSLKKILKKNYLDFRGLEDYQNIQTSSPENLKQLNEDLDNLLNELLLEEDLKDLEVFRSKANWDDEEDLDSAIIVLKQIKKEVDTKISLAREVEKDFSLAKAKLDKSLKKATENSLKEDVKTKPQIFKEWQDIWFDVSKDVGSWSHGLPFTKSSRNLKTLEKLESSFINDIPQKTRKSFLDKKGKIDRNKLSELVEILEDFSVNKSRFVESNEKAIDLAKEYELILNDLRDAKVSTEKIEKNFDWLDLQSCVEQNLKDTASLKKLYEKLEKSLTIQKNIKSKVDDIFSIRMANTLVKSWFRSSYGKEYENSLNKFNRECSHENAKNFQKIYRKKPFNSFLDDWKKSLELFIFLEEINKEIKSLSSNERFEKIIEGFPSNIFLKPAMEGYHDTNKLEDFITKCKKLNEDIMLYENKTKNEIIGQYNKEIRRVTKQLSEASSFLEKKKQEKVNHIITNIQSGEYKEYPANEIADAFEKFNEQVLKAELDSLNQQLAALSFNQAKNKWSKKISSDESLQESIQRLRGSLQSQRGKINEGAFSDFKKALKAIPIWISTAQSSQSIPMIPGLFDLVIIDEASQCDVTKAIPLIYRGTSLAAIGDPQQLPSIPSITTEEENSIIAQNDYEDFPGNLRHSNNNIFQASFMNLFQAAKNQIMLIEHFRSHPLIIGFSNLNIYYKRYSKALKIKKPDKYSNDYDGLSYHQVTGNCTRSSGSSSWTNVKEAREVVKIVKAIKSNKETKYMSIGVVTPFRKQKDLILEFLNEIGLVAGIIVGTAHTYQGQEKDIMIFSTVVSNGMDRSSALWMSNPPNLMNVGITRAKRKLVIVGDMDYCETNFGGEILGRLAKYCKKIDRLDQISKEQKKLFELLILHGIEPEIEHPIADMNVDFFIPKAGQGLVIEVDGQQHENERMQDESRDATLRSLNNKVLRFPARDVRETPSLVIEDILKHLQ